MITVQGTLAKSCEPEYAHEPKISRHWIQYIYVYIYETKHCPRSKVHSRWCLSSYTDEPLRKTGASEGRLRSQIITWSSTHGLCCMARRHGWMQLRRFCLDCPDKLANLLGIKPSMNQDGHPVGFFCQMSQKCQYHLQKYPKWKLYGQNLYKWSSASAISESTTEPSWAPAATIFLGSQ